MGWILPLVVAWTATAVLSMVLVAGHANRRDADALFWGVATMFSGVVGALLYALVRLVAGSGNDRSVGRPISPHRHHRDRR